MIVVIVLMYVGRFENFVEQFSYGQKQGKLQRRRCDRNEVRRCSKVLRRGRWLGRVESCLYGCSRGACFCSVVDFTIGRRNNTNRHCQGFISHREKVIAWL